MAEPRHHRLLDAEALSKLASLQLRAGAVVDGTMAGLHRSPHHGSSIEFAEHKEYAPGDDIRRLDWKAFAKFDRPFIRQYEDETDLKAYLLLDCSGSMGYGEPLSKLEYGSVLVASLAYLLARQRDQPSLVAFADSLRAFVPPRSRSDHMAQLFTLLEDLRATGETRLDLVLAQLTERMARRSLVVLVSDLFDVSAETRGLLRHLRARKHRVVVFHLLHDDEIDFPFSALTLFEAMESAHRVLVDPGGLRQAYRVEIKRFLETVERECKEGEILYQLVRTSQPLDGVLLGLLRSRERRR